MPRLLVIGAGGLGCAALLALEPVARAADLAITIVDPDRVERSNLHRQVLYGERDVGAPKADLAAAWARSHAGVAARAIVGRFDAEGAVAIARAHDIVIEGTDRLETKFLAADACALASVPVVHAGIVRWSGWAMGSVPGASACLRCVFEEPPGPDASVPTCAEAGVIGAAVGALGAIEAALALRLASGDHGAAGVVLRYDALAGVARSSPVRRRATCALCGEAPTIRTIESSRYAPACPA
jgi:molybdopterin/thiamine biosynthesis adenylyltransferase